MYEEIEDKVMTECPHCGSKNIRKAGHLPSGYQRYHCKDCNKKISALTTAKYYRKTDVQCPYCKSYHTRLAGTLKDGTRRHLCRDCGKGFSAKTIIREEITEKCPFCNSSNLRREGIRNGVQRYYCRDCKTVFTPGSQKENWTHQKIVKAYRKGYPVWALAKSFDLTPRSIYRHVKRCNHAEHVEKVLKTLPTKTKKDIIYYRLGAGVSYSDITEYLKVDKEVAQVVVKRYINEVNELGRLHCQELDQLKKRL